MFSTNKDITIEVSKDLHENAEIAAESIGLDVRALTKASLKRAVEEIQETGNTVLGRSKVIPMGKTEDGKHPVTIFLTDLQYGLLSELLTEYGVSIESASKLMLFSIYSWLEQDDQIVALVRNVQNPDAEFMVGFKDEIEEFKQRVSSARSENAIEGKAS